MTRAADITQHPHFALRTAWTADRSMIPPRTAELYTELLEGAYQRVQQAREGQLARQGDMSAVNAAKEAYFELRVDVERVEQEEREYHNSLIDDDVERCVEDGLIEGVDFGVSR